MRNICGAKISNGDLGDGGTQEELMLGNVDVIWFLRRVYYAFCAFLESCLELRPISKPFEYYLSTTVY